MYLAIQSKMDFFSIRQGFFSIRRDIKDIRKNMTIKCADFFSNSEP